MLVEDISFYVQKYVLNNMYIIYIGGRYMCTCVCYKQAQYLKTVKREIKVSGEKMSPELKLKCLGLMLP